ncbi:MAG: hypothetical protein R3275_11025 [Saprospiraceae bacterium]|nr:hypothetical protein [Saprospiraceae bacterium]
MRLSRLIMIPFVVAGGYMLYQMFFHDQYQYSYFLIIPVVVVAASLALAPQLDEIGYKWWPTKADDTLKRILMQSSPSLIWVRPEDREAFFSMSINAIRKMDFIGMKVDDIPTDVKIMSIYPGVLMEYLFGVDLLTEYNRVVFYKHPFPSPEYKKWHSGEVHYKDGVLLLSLEQMIPNYTRSGDFYHIVFDLWIRALLRSYPDVLNKDLLDQDIDWGKKDLNLEKARAYLGLDIVLQRHVNMLAFFRYPQLSREKTPDLFKDLSSKILN